MATTFSLLAVFLPIGFMGGIVGRFMSSFGFTASFAIAVSLLVSFTLTPMLTSRFVKVLPEARGREATEIQGFALLPLPGSATTRACSSGPWRIARSMVAISVARGAEQRSRSSCWWARTSFPADDRSEFQVNVRAPEGTSLAATVTIAERIARDIRDLPGVTATLTSVGIGSASFTGSSCGRIE